MLRTIRKYAGIECDKQDQAQDQHGTQSTGHGQSRDREMLPIVWHEASASANCGRSSVPTDGAPVTIHQELFSRVKAWAGDDPKRWQHLHNALLKIYAPTWERIDSRDILVSWVGAYLGLTTAQQQLKRIAEIQQPLTHTEQISKGAREADISFYCRLIARMDDKVLQAFSEDTEATRVIEKAISKGVKRDSARTDLEESSS